MNQKHGPALDRRAAGLGSWLTLLSALSLVSSNPALAFDKGTSSIAITVSAGRALDRTYTVIGGRLGHYVADGFELAIGAEFWTDNDPDIFKLTPEARYVWYGTGPIKPYAGGFISRTMYNGLPDRNTYGARGGAYFQVSRNAHVGAGLVYERVESCDRAAYRDCDQFYPEAAFNVRF